MKLGHSCMSGLCINEHTLIVKSVGSWILSTWACQHVFIIVDLATETFKLPVFEIKVVKPDEKR